MGTIQQEFEKIGSQVEAEIKQKLKEERDTILAELKAATPIDTGNARNNWKVSMKDKNSFILDNETPYINKLNQGSSKQAPRFFIESVALRHGKPIGTIVTNKS